MVDTSPPTPHRHSRLCTPPRRNGSSHQQPHRGPRHAGLDSRSRGTASQVGMDFAGRAGQRQLSSPRGAGKGASDGLRDGARSGDAPTNQCGGASTRGVALTPMLSRATAHRRGDPTVDPDGPLCGGGGEEGLGRPRRWMSWCVGKRNWTGSPSQGFFTHR
jgi:hypothetical protein